MSVEKRVRAYLELAAKDAEAADLLLAGGNRYSAYHIQQAVEKITKHCSSPAASKPVSSTDSRSYSSASQVKMSGQLDYCRLLVIPPTRRHFRYPTPGGRIPVDPPADLLRRDISSIRDLIAVARKQLLSSAADR